MIVVCTTILYGSACERLREWILQFFSKYAFSTRFWPTVSSANHIGMDSSTGQLSAFNFEVRGRTPTTNRNLSRDSSTMFSSQAMPYHNRMDVNMDCNSTVGDSTPELLYETEQEKALHVSKVADYQEPMRPMGGNNEAPPTYTSSKESTINIQLPYNPQAFMEPDL